MLNKNSGRLAGRRAARRPKLRRSQLRLRNGLLPREAALVREFAKDFNVTKAAIRAGYSARTAHVQGSQVLRRLRVRTALEVRLAELADRADASAERVIRELGAIGFSARGTLRRGRTGPSV